jgi:alginate O-acetyltransferase complex protein AlgI
MLFISPILLFLYAWGEKSYVLLLALIALHYVFGVLPPRRRTPPWQRRAIPVAVAVNLGILAAFKYASFLVANVNLVLTRLHIAVVAPPALHMPLGISFFALHALPCILAVYRP